MSSILWERPDFTKSRFIETPTGPRPNYSTDPEYFEAGPRHARTNSKDLKAYGNPSTNLFPSG